MKNPLRTYGSLNLGLLLPRLPMGAFFLIAGYQKWSGGIDKFVANNIGSVPSQLPFAWGDHYLHALPYMEMAVGGALILGLLTRLAGLVGSLMVLTFIIGATHLRGNNPYDQMLPFHPNLIYFGLLFGILLTGPGRASVDGLLFGAKAKPKDH